MTGRRLIEVAGALLLIDDAIAADFAALPGGFRDVGGGLIDGDGDLTDDLSLLFDPGGLRLQFLDVVPDLGDGDPFAHLPIAKGPGLLALANTCSADPAEAGHLMTRQLRRQRARLARKGQVPQQQLIDRIEAIEGAT